MNEAYYRLLGNSITMLAEVLEYLQGSNPCYGQRDDAEWLGHACELIMRFRYQENWQELLCAEENADEIK